MPNSEDAETRSFAGRARRGVLVHLDPKTLDEIDEFIRNQPQPISRPEAIRKLVSMGLPRTIEVSVSE